MPRRLLRVRLGDIAFLAAALFLMLPESGWRSAALAQACRPETIGLVFTDGARKSVFTCGNWHGVTDEGIDAFDIRVSGSSKTPVPRSQIRFVCRGECPNPLPSDRSAEDMVTWKDGSRTRGHVDVRCRSSACEVFQNGVHAGPPGDVNWDSVSHIELAPGAR
jgi:hypothetical protein